MSGLRLSNRVTARPCASADVIYDPSIPRCEQMCQGSAFVARVTSIGEGESMMTGVGLTR
jgi:hypothetical protein